MHHSIFLRNYSIFCVSRNIFQTKGTVLENIKHFN
jgi:hypothetical protein